MIVRPQYIDILNTYRDVPLVKILAGIRRCGKSTILEMFKTMAFHPTTLSVCVTPLKISMMT